jgi:hypothetical protein
VRYDRHASYRAALRAGVLEGLGEGRTLESVWADPGKPTAAAVRRRVTQDRDGFAVRYWMMCEVGRVSAEDRTGIWMVRSRKDASPNGGAAPTTSAATGCAATSAGS